MSAEWVCPECCTGYLSEVEAAECAVCESREEREADWANFQRERRDAERDSGVDGNS